VKLESTLPYAITIAAKATEIDNIKVIPVNSECGIAQSFWAFRIFNYKKRLVRRAVRNLNRDIRKALKKDPNVKLYIYALAYHEYYDYTIHLHMDYKIK